MNTTAVYSPLECLLLFQSLVAQGTQDEAFIRISDLLTNNSLVKDGETYDAQRLTAEALRELYLRLLRAELRAEDQDEEDTHSKKRKIQTPALPSIQDAEEYGDKLPAVVDRLYARYREYMVQAIREEERRYAAVQKDIAEIERGEWDERILKESKMKVNGTPAETALPKANGTGGGGQKHLEIIAKLPEPTPRLSPLQPPQLNHRPDGLTGSDVLNNQEQISPQRIAESSRHGSQGHIAPHLKVPSTGPHGPSPLQTHQPLRVGSPQHQNYGWAPPYQPGQQLNAPQYNPQYQAPYPQQQQSRGQNQSPLLPPPFTVPSSPMSAQSPSFAQNAVGVPQSHHRSSPNSPGGPFHNPSDTVGQYGPSQHIQPQLSQSPHPSQYRPNPASPLGPQGQPVYPPHYVPRPSPTGQFQQWQQGQMSPAPSHYSQNFQLGYGPPPPQQQFQSPQPALQSIPSTYNSPYNPGNHQPPQTLLRSQPSQPVTPTTPRLSSFSTGFGTRWTPIALGQTPGPYVAISRPKMEPISPILGPAQIPPSGQNLGRKGEKTDLPKSKAPRRGTQRTRAGSATSSVVVGSRRSQSVISHADELSLDDTVPRLVKEEVNTPSGIEDQGDTTAEDSSAHHLLPLYSKSRQSTKRKRGFSDIEAHLPVPPTHVQWTRAFPKISASALESITAHKNASTFSAPVKERDAPGYKNLILRPQDLKSIRSAINAGHRAATTAAPEDISPSASSVLLPISEDLIPPKAIINYSQFEKELMRMFANAIMFNPDPDRGLGRRFHGMGKEKDELVGYEFDEDSVVKETRAMFTDVERIVESLKNAERKIDDVRETDSTIATRGVEDDDIDELAGDGEHSSTMGSVAKRRRKA